jgi:large subunit ribosomal protein L3
MPLGIFGTKLGITRIFDDKGGPIPVTVISAGPCPVLRMKTPETDGYRALLVAYRPCPEKRLTKPLLGIFRKLNLPPHRYLGEFPLEEDESLPDDLRELTVSLFKPGDLLSIQGRTKGRGFQGVIKRHGFGGGKDSHGSKFHRAPGSSGTNTTPGRVLKGKRFPGHFGNERCTIKNLEVVEVIPEENLLLVKGAVPGARGGLLKVYKVEKG